MTIRDEVRQKSSARPGRRGKEWHRAGICQPREATLARSPPAGRDPAGAALPSQCAAPGPGRLGTPRIRGDPDASRHGRDAGAGRLRRLVWPASCACVSVLGGWNRQPVHRRRPAARRA